MMIAETFSPLTRWAWLTRERVIWLGVIGIATILRIWDLGGRPLDRDEVRLAMDALRNLGLGREYGAPDPANPAYLSILSIIFFLFTSSDAGARIISALSGIGSVGMLYFLRDRMPGGAALGGAVILALSPLHVDFSRSVTTGASLGLVLLCVTAAVTELHARRFQSDDAQRPWAIVLGAALALGLGIDTTFVLHLLVIGGSLLFAFDIGKIRSLIIDFRDVCWKPVLVAFVLTVILADTRLLTNPGGVQNGLVATLWEWVPQVLGPGRVPALPLLQLAGSEILLIGFATAGAVTASRGTSFERFSAAWALLALGVALIVGRAESRFIAPVLIAGALSGGRAIAAVATGRIWRDHTSLLIGLAGMVPLVAMLVAALPSLRNAASPAVTIFIAGIAGVAGCAVGGYALAGLRATRDGFIALACLLMMLGSVGGFGHNRQPLDSDVGKITPGITLTPPLREVERQLSIWEWDQDRRALLADDRTRDVLGWALRGSRRAIWQAGDSITTGPAVKLAATRGESLPEGARRITVGYQASLPADLNPSKIINWLIWRQPILRTEAYDILLLR